MEILGLKPCQPWLLVFSFLVTTFVRSQSGQQVTSSRQSHHFVSPKSQTKRLAKVTRHRPGHDALGQSFDQQISHRLSPIEPVSGSGHGFTKLYTAQKMFCLNLPREPFSDRDVQLYSSFPQILRKGSTPKLGVSTISNVGTPSAFRLSKKFLHSIIRRVHSASALPAYLLGPAAAPSGLSGLFAGPLI